MTQVLGIVLAGGISSRFGSDKAAALIAGKSLLDHVCDALSPQVDALAIVGRDCADRLSIGDRPSPDLGPLGGLSGALFEAGHLGYSAILTAGCDMLPVPANLREMLEIGPAVVIKGQPLFGYWSTELSPILDQYIGRAAGLSMRGWINESGARKVVCDTPFHNFNTPDDLLLYSAS